MFCDIITYPHTNGEVAMPVSYDKLWKILIDKKMKRSDLKDAAGISFNVLAKMGKNEFVSILGQSGCGKTTLLNIIGGLDRYTSGNLIINRKINKRL